MPPREPAPILVVDDDPKIVALVRTYLERERYPVVTAGDGRAALRAIEEHAPPDPAGFADGAVELGRLRATDGSFNTPIPPGIDTGAARSVVIWCREFAVLFAVAPLDG